MMGVGVVEEGLGRWLLLKVALPEALLLCVSGEALSCFGSNE